MPLVTSPDAQSRWDTCTAAEATLLLAIFALARLRKLAVPALFDAFPVNNLLMSGLLYDVLALIALNAST